MASNAPAIPLRRQRQSITKRETSAQQYEQEPTPLHVENNDSDDDLEVDLAKAALATGTAAFESQQWMEAESLLEEARRVLETLPRERRAFCDIFDLHFMMSVCTYYTQDHATAEEALISLRQHEVISDAQQERMCEASHLLSQLYAQMGRVDLAKAECESTLQVRRRMFGKRSDASFESMALMAHIYVMLDNRALAKTYLSMITEERRETILKRLGISLGMEMGHLDFSSIMYSQPPEMSFPAMKRAFSEHAASSAAAHPTGRDRTQPPPATPHSPAPSRSSVATSASSPKFWQSPPRHVHEEISPQLQQAGWNTPPSSTTGTFDVAAALDQRVTKAQNTTVSTHNLPATTERSLEIREQRLPQPPSTPAKPLSRKNILEKVGCQPRDNIEEAVCKGDHAGLAKLLDKKKGFWRGSLRKHVRPERVTALHFAALFGEVDMARCLIATNFNINEVPFGYSTSLTPLHFALGARQVEMIRFLINNGARPVEPDTWSTLASQLMTRSWLLKTLSDSERDGIANRIIACLELLLNAGWQINMPYGTAKTTVLHQAVAFWTGSYKMDMELRAAVTQFLCNRGANPLRKNSDGKTAWDIASNEGHQDLLKILDEAGRRADMGNMQPVELPGQ
ncbi:hypothetical protein E8E12_008084 [Didymella heteroderae]|uniref:Ankyrin n=1 Tax=Didymella heteroderae TaxID=1769908 RepID=A0A9P4WRX6_9PLEO|nr:hypothetical protein E8E12_008084 [Didymella heteroderae]